MKLIAESEGATLRDATRLVVYVTDMFRFRPLVNKVQEELWGQGPYRRARSSRSTGSIRTTFSRSRARSTPRSEKMRPSGLGVEVGPALHICDERLIRGGSRTG
jgi:hypothetical protein